MRTNLGKKMGTGVLVLLLTVCFIPTVALAAPGEGRQGKGFEQRDRHRPGLGIWRDQQMVQKLGLTDEQVQKLRDADYARREKRLESKAQLDSLRLQMDKAFSDDILDKNAVRLMAEKIADIRGQMFVQKIESRLALAEILSKDQLTTLKLEKKNDRRQGKRHGKNRSSGGDGNRGADGNQRARN